MNNYTNKLVCCLITIMYLAPIQARVVLSQSTDEPIAYASVGVINRSLGTVTDTLGRFSLSVPAEFINDSLKISSVGYVPKVFAVRDIDKVPDTIRLADDIVILAEVEVKPQIVEHKTAGRKGSGGFIYLDLEGYKAAGQGLAIPIKVNKRVWLKGLGFTIVSNSKTLTHMKFRINVYEKDGETYTLMNSVKQIYFDYNKSDLVDGHFHFDFPEDIMLDKGEYYAELEFLENFTGEYFLMKSKPLTGQTRYRYASQSDWKTLPFGCTLYFEYDTLK